MLIQLVSYRYTEESTVNLTADIINRSEADLIVFSGTYGTNLRACDIPILESQITNRHVIAYLDARKGCSKYNNLFELRNGRFTDLDSKQIFHTSGLAIAEGGKLSRALVSELKGKRLFRVQKKSLLLMLCGENNIVINRMPKRPEHHVEFRLNDSSLESDFEKVMAKADIIINPTHSMNPRPWIYHERGEFFSSFGRYYFFAANGNDFNSPNIQYAYHDGKLMKKFRTEDNSDYISRFYTI